MSIPAQAFADRLPNDLSPGSIFLFRKSWAMLVNNQQEEGDPVLAFLMLQGERAGSLFKVGEGMTRCLTLAEPFGWFASVKEVALPAHDVVDTASLSLTPHGPVVVGQMPSQWGTATRSRLAWMDSPVVSIPVARLSALLHGALSSPIRLGLSLA
ncbi:hypothetical protein VDR86_20205 [Xanthomonas campestris pv. campestris]|uniref:hypothetical protein n=1 Tax=Xanthomonas campestris TaxID=339 RepID=UPI002368097D|nr:hypothetical protein [Xanthomonas campestris]MDM7706255.1 hypothetical protein [Xanthomonas campestris pv. campestris]MDM7880960.1 hypothetical protein [Xanthomonas campestris pv. campestris]MDO0860873.1 hypothetical protein [Xanthomonas campestris pv. campestris]MEB1935944.1 hypothetical protein [Xanthomonas campestris pv. campestris]MEB1948475.1 hypothetical protein [Xanthomonas campestris pv. campestris]